MELILISESKLKIMLTSDDMQHFELDASTIDYSDLKTRTALRHILEAARKETGFDSSSDRVFIQIYPSRKGGCEMFVTRLDIVCAGEGSAEKGLVPIKDGSQGCKPGALRSATFAQHPGELAYSFDSLESLISLCRRLGCFGNFESSSAYLDLEGRYFLLFNEIDGKAACGGKFSFIDEYGSREDAISIRIYIREYGKCICPSNAVLTLGKC